MESSVLQVAAADVISVSLSRRIQLLPQADGAIFSESRPLVERVTRQ